MSVLVLAAHQEKVPNEVKGFFLFLHSASSIAASVNILFQKSRPSILKNPEN